jgi:hypothetical protein
MSDAGGFALGGASRRRFVDGRGLKKQAGIHFPSSTKWQGF